MTLKEFDSFLKGTMVNGLRYNEIAASQPHSKPGAPRKDVNENDSSLQHIKPRAPRNKVTLASAKTLPLRASAVKGLSGNSYFPFKLKIILVRNVRCNALPAASGPVGIR